MRRIGFTILMIACIFLCAMNRTFASAAYPFCADIDDHQSNAGNDMPMLIYALATADDGTLYIYDNVSKRPVDIEYSVISDRWYKPYGILLYCNDEDNIYWGFVDCVYGYISKPEFVNIYISTDPSNMIIGLDEGGYNGMGFYSRPEARMIIEPQYSGEYYTEFKEGWAWVMIINNNDYDDFTFALIDESNNRLKLPNGVEPLSGFSQNRCRVFSTETKLEGYIDKTGNIVINCQYSSARDFDSSGHAYVKDIEGNSMIIDINGLPVTAK